MKAINYKHKNYILLLGFVLALVVIWKLSLSKTWEFYQDNQRIKAQIQSASNAPGSIRDLKADLAQMNAKITRFDAGESNQQELIGYVSRFAIVNDLKVIEIPKAISEKNNGFNIETSILKIQGDYKKVLTMIYDLEAKDHLCKVAGADFQRTIDVKTHQEYLVATLYLQNIKKLKL